MPKEIVLSTEAMTFFLLNMFGHDPALHDFTPSSLMAKKECQTPQDNCSKLWVILVVEVVKIYKKVGNLRKNWNKKCKKP
jgi:hypothetical protein